MSGTFQREIYDVKAYETAVKQSTGPLMYLMNPLRNDAVHPARLIEPGFNGKVGVSITHQRPLIDVESDLFGIDIKNSKDPNQRYEPRCPQCGMLADGMPTGGGVSNGCSECNERLYNLPKLMFNRDYTRTSNPVCTAREVGINRFQPLNINPQDPRRWLQQAEVGINYRMVVKDNHVPVIPRLKDQTTAHPKIRPCHLNINPVILSNGYMGTHILPMHKYAKTRSSFRF